MNKQTPLAIVGIGCLFPKASNLKEFWANVKRRVDGITEVPATHWSPSDYWNKDQKAPDMTYGRRGGFLNAVEFDAAEFGISPNTLEATDAAQLLGLVAAQMALRDAGYGPEKEYDRNKVSVILGVTGTLELVIPLGARLGHPIWRKALAEHGIEGAAADSIVESIKDGYVPWQENSFPGLLGNVVAGRIANRFNLGGTNCVVDAACASSLSAAHLAALELEAGRSKMVITGGVDCFNDIFMYMCFSKTPALSSTGDAKPFDKKADGTILGEGLGMVVLKRLEDAEKDGDKIYAVLKGIGSSSDGRGKSIYAPSSEGQTKALRKAYEVSGVSPSTVELVEAHGTGTVAGDGAELEALKGVYREARPDGSWAALGSVKSMIGHTKAAAGSAAMIKAALALYHKVLPPTIKVDDPIPGLADSPFYLNTLPRPWPRGEHPRRAACSALGFGGSNFHAVLEEYSPEMPDVDWDGQVQIVALSGDVASQLKEWEKPMSWDEVRVKAHESRKKFKATDAERHVFVLEKDAKSRTSYSGSGPKKKLAVLFAGQGSQYAGMNRDLSCAFPEALETLSAANEAFKGGRLTDLMYPAPSFTEEGKKAQEEALRSTDAAQPALGAAALSQWKILRRFGLAADAFAGHSYGELTALCAAGRISEADLHALSGLRGRLMKLGDGGRGAMLAVAAPLADVEYLLKAEGLDLVVANKNAPKQNVLSGSKEEIERAAALCEAKGMKAVRLPVSAAFHSPLVASAVPEFKAALKKVKFAPGAPVYANLTAAPYSENAAETLASQLSSPVEFTAMIARMRADGCERFLELGPGGRLTGLLGQMFDGKDAVALDSSNGKRHGMADLARALAQLAAWGHELDLTAWEDGEAGVAEILTRKKAKMPVTLTGANYRSTKPAPRSIVKPTTHNAPAPMPQGNDAVQALHRLQQQTAELHQKFLESQMAMAQAFAAMVGGAPMPAVPVVQAPPPPPPPAPKPQPVAQSSGVEQTVLAVVAEKTGYPVDTLNPEMDLESDLGIDSIKRVEIMAALGQKLPNAPKAKPEHLGTLRTLRKIVEFLSEGGFIPQTLEKPSSGTAAPAGGQVEPVVLAVVAEKTGYPIETLNPEMDLESDLGIDSIKRVEIMAALAQKLPDAPKAKPEHLGTLRTLKKIVEFLSAGAAPANGVEPVVLAVVAEKTGYPVETLNPDMDLESDLGIDSIKRVEIMSALAEKLPGAPRAKPEHLGTLRTLRKIVEFLGNTAPVSAAAKPAPAPVKAAANLKRLVLKEAPLSGERTKLVLPDGTIYVAGEGAAVVARLKALGYKAKPLAMDEGLPAAAALIIVAPKRKAGELWDEQFEQFMRRAFMLGVQAATNVSGAFLTVSRMDGVFGLTGLTAEQDPISGALAGLAKTAGKEWPRVSCKAIDCADLPEEAMAELVAEELLLRGPDEVGFTSQGKRVLVLEEHPQAEGKAALGPSDTVLVTGGARGVTAAAALELAKACKPALLLWGRSVPGEDVPGTEAELKKHFAAKGLSPRDIGPKVAKILADREIRTNLAALEAAGSKVTYDAVDVRDAGAVKKALAGKNVTAIVHGAGVLADKRLEDKTLEGFDAVWGTKVTGLRNILSSVNLSALKGLGLFSSSTARYGRLGQADYAMANEALNKIARLLSRRLPKCRVASIGWGPWDGGMVTDSLKGLFASEGVGLIGLEAGGKLLVSELSNGSRAVETVVLGESSQWQTAFERTVSAEEWPILNSHRIKGKPVVPAALLLEMMAHGAMHGQPGMPFAGLESLRILKGVILNGEAKLSVVTGTPSQKDGLTAVPVEVRGEGGRHCSATILLGTNGAAPQAAPGIAPSKNAPNPYDILFHGEDMRFIQSVNGLSDQGIETAVSAALPPKQWLAKPWRDRWIADPAALDAAFQAMIVYTNEILGAPSLPTFLGSYRQYAAWPANGTTVRCRAKANTADVDFLDARGKVVARLTGYECTVDPSLKEAFAR